MCSQFKSVCKMLILLKIIHQYINFPYLRQTRTDLSPPSCLERADSPSSGSDIPFKVTKEKVKGSSFSHWWFILWMVVWWRKPIPILLRCFRLAWQTAMLPSWLKKTPLSPWNDFTQFFHAPCDCCDHLNKLKSNLSFPPQPSEVSSWRVYFILFASFVSLICGCQSFQLHVCQRDCIHDVSCSSP